jgi:F-type H+-transporting ATPase subunit a
MAAFTVLLAAGTARAEEGAYAPEGAAAVAEAGHGGEGHEAAAKEEHHWSLADYFVPMTFTEFMRENFGESVIEKKPVSHTTHVAFGVVVFLTILVLLGFSAARLRSSRKDMLPQSRFNPLAVFEVLADALLGLMEGIMGREKALKFLPLVGSLGTFILFSNLMGLIPGILPPTDNLNTTFALGSVVFVATHYHGVRAHGISYFKHFLGPIVKWYALPLMILMLIIELISHVARPVSLGVRLLGNIFGDHAVMAAAVGSGLILVPVPAIVLGLFVSVVQAAVFCILSTVYIALATQEEEHGEEAHGKPAHAH